MVNVGHRPGVTPMTADRLLILANVVLERVGSTCSFSCHCPVVDGLVALYLCVESSLSRWGKLVFFALFEVFAIRTPLRFPGHGIVVRLQHVVDECPHFGSQPCPPALVIVREEADEPTPITKFCFSVQTPPGSLRLLRHFCPYFRCAFLLVVIILIRIDDPVAKHGPCHIHISRTLQEFLAFRGNTGLCLCLGTNNFALLHQGLEGGMCKRKGLTPLTHQGNFMLPYMHTTRPAVPHDRASLRDHDRVGIHVEISWLLATVAMRACCLPIAEDQRTLWLCQSMRAAINLDCVPGNGNIDLVGIDPRCDHSKISKRYPWMLVNNPIERLQICIWKHQTIQGRVIVFQVQPVVLGCPVHLI